VSDIIKSAGDRELAGALAIGLGSANPCLDVVGACKGNKFVALASAPVSFDAVPVGGGRLLALVPTLCRMALASVGQTFKARRNGVRTKFIFGTSLSANEVGPMIYAEFLPSALAEGRYRAAPAPLVFGAGLDCLQGAFDALSKGVSASKLVVTL
jgi:hypothetical protein